MPEFGAGRRGEDAGDGAFPAEAHGYDLANANARRAERLMSALGDRESPRPASAAEEFDLASAGFPTW
jgi:hypothetical protein